MFPFSDDVPRQRTPLVTFAIVLINLLAYLYTLTLTPLEQQEFAFAHGFMPARIGQLAHHQPLIVSVDDIEQEAPWLPPVMVRHEYTFQPVAGPIWLSLLTCMFLHGGFMHLASNMWLLWIFGDNVEDRLGRIGYLCFYLLGGLAASGLQYWMDPTSTVPVIGASGAIAAVLGAFAVTWPWANVYSLVFVVFFATVIRLPALLILGGWFLLQLFEGGRSLGADMSGGVAWWAHIGGFLMGALLMPLVRRDPPTPESGEDGYEWGMIHAD